MCRAAPIRSNVIVMKGGRAVAQLLRDYGIKYLMGVPGGQTYPIYVGISEFEPEIKHLLFHCERCAGFAAVGFSRVTGKVCAFDGTVGPGGAYMIPSVSEAKASSDPILAITADVDSTLSGRNAAQEADMISMFRPFVKESFFFNRVEKIPGFIRRAFRMATSDRPGPVHLDFPADVLASECDFGDDLYVEPIYANAPANRSIPEMERVSEAADLIISSRYPIIFVGHGAIISEAWDEIREFAELLNAPVVTTMMGKGVIAEDHPLSLGAAMASYETGRYLSRAKKILAQSDLAILIGTNTDEISTYTWTIPFKNTRIIHIDIDPMEIGRNFRTEVGMLCDAKKGLEALNNVLRPRLSRLTPRKDRASEVAECVRTWRDSMKIKTESDEVPINPHRVVKEIREALNKDSILVCDASFSSWWGAYVYDVLRPGRNYVAPRGTGVLGFGLPATIGAKLAFPEKQVLGIGGDGGFMYSIHELETANRLGLNFTYVVLNDSALGSARIYFQNNYKKVISCNFTDLDYSKLADDFGCHGIRVERPSDLAGAIRNGIGSDKPTIIDVVSKSEGPYISEELA